VQAAGLPVAHEIDASPAEPGRQFPQLGEGEGVSLLEIPAIAWTVGSASPAVAYCTYPIASE